MISLRRFRLFAVQLSLGITVAAGLIALPFDTKVTWGIFTGGIAGTLLFWIKARRLEKRLPLVDGRLVLVRQKTDAKACHGT